jgi:D-alanyl-D-alanine carboxypeptidase (penicillin-binding protein 5/6)
VNFRLYTLTLIALLGLGFHASANETIPVPPAIAAKAYILLDAKSGRVLAEQNADERLEPASLTKIMTAYITFQELSKGTLHLDDMAPFEILYRRSKRT